METNKRSRGRGAQDGAQRAPSPSHPRGHVIPAKAGTYRRTVRLRNSGNLLTARLRGNDNRLRKGKRGAWRAPAILRRKRQEDSHG